MRLYLLVALGAAAGLALGAVVVVLDPHAPLPAAPPPVASEAAGSGGASLTPESAQAPAPAATPGPRPATVAEAAPPAKPPASDLPSVDVAPLTVHTVPDSEPPAPSVTVVDRNGRTLKELNPSAGLSPP